MIDSLAYRGWLPSGLQKHVDRAAHTVSRLHPQQFGLKNKLQEFIDKKIGEVLDCSQDAVRNVIRASYHWSMLRSMLHTCEFKETVNEVVKHNDGFKQSFADLQSTFNMKLLHCTDKVEANRTRELVHKAETQSAYMESRLKKLKKLYAVVKKLDNDSFDKADKVKNHLQKTINLHDFYKTEGNQDMRRRRKLEVLEFTRESIRDKENLKKLSSAELSDSLEAKKSITLQETLDYYVKFFIRKDVEEIFTTCDS